MIIYMDSQKVCRFPRIQLIQFSSPPTDKYFNPTEPHLNVMKALNPFVIQKAISSIVNPIVVKVDLAMDSDGKTGKRKIKKFMF